MFNKNLVGLVLAGIFIISCCSSKYKNSNKVAEAVVAAAAQEPVEQDPTPEPEPQPEPDPSVDLIGIPIYKQRLNEDSEYAEIINRVKDPVLEYNRGTNAHESVHFLNSDLRNAKQKEIGYTEKLNAFYVPTGCVFYVKEPNMRKREVAPYVPQSLRWNRYKTYVIGQTAWDDRPLYLVDEWVAYIAGGLVDVQDIKKGRHNGEWSDGVSGVMEFSIYCTALCMAIKDKDSNYWNTQVQFKEFVKMMLNMAHKVYFTGKDLDELKWDKQEQLRHSLRTSADAEPIRKFMRDELSDVWLRD